jgi:hypothetical protein
VCFFFNLLPCSIVLLLYLMWLHFTLSPLSSLLLCLRPGVILHTALYMFTPTLEWQGQQDVFSEADNLRHNLHWIFLSGADYMRSSVDNTKKFPPHRGEGFLISNFRYVLHVVCFLMGNSLASEFYMPTFRNTLSVLSS